MSRTINAIAIAIAAAAALFAALAWPRPAEALLALSTILLARSIDQQRAAIEHLRRRNRP